MCGPGPCGDWDGDPAQAVSGIRIRALTKHEEGGNRRTGKTGAHADFIFAVRRQDPNSELHVADAKELRILVQAKRADFSQPNFLPDLTSMTIWLRRQRDTAPSRIMPCTCNSPAHITARLLHARVPNLLRIGQWCSSPLVHPTNPMLYLGARS